jgi:hypothetical protein
MASAKSATRLNQAPAAPDERGLDEVDAASAASMDASDPPAHGGVTGVGGTAGPEQDRLQRISARAHELWQAAGSADGKSLEFWLEAERQVDGETAA